MTKSKSRQNSVNHNKIKFAAKIWYCYEFVMLCANIWPKNVVHKFVSAAKQENICVLHQKFCARPKNFAWARLTGSRHIACLLYILIQRSDPFEANCWSYYIESIILFYNNRILLLLLLLLLTFFLSISEICNSGRILELKVSKLPYWHTQ